MLPYIKQVEVLFTIEETIARSIITYSNKNWGQVCHCIFFYEPRSRYIEDQSGSAKEAVSPKISENIEMLVCFICVGTQDMILIDINHHYQITMNQPKNLTLKFNINIYKVTFSLYQLLMFVIYLFRQRDRKKKFLPTGGSWLFFISPSWWIWNEILGLILNPVTDLF